MNVYAVIRDLAQENGGYWPTNEQLAERLGLTLDEETDALLTEARDHFDALVAAIGETK